MPEPSLSRLCEQSTVVGVLGALVATLRRWTGQSTLATHVRRIQHSVSVAVSTSAPARGGRRLLTWLRESYLYRWLTAEPDPQVVVIDLRETRTVGPFVRASDWVLSRTADFAQHARLVRIGAETAAAVRRGPVRIAGVVVCLAVLTDLALTVLSGTVGGLELAVHAAVFLTGLVGTQIRVPLETLADARTVRLLRAAFEPPEPVERPDRETGTTRPGRDE